MLTARQKQAYDFIANRILSTAVPPTYVEIGRHLGSKSKGSVAQLVGQLIRRGYLIRPYLGRHCANLDLARRPSAGRLQYFRFDDETKQLVEWQP
jgi:SOS-response transcriptional repressor LexA